MKSLYAVVWFFFLFICPVVTLAALILSAAASRTAKQLILCGIVTILALVLLLGPVWTDIGPMPWWFSGANLVSFANARYLIWQYALVCLGAYAALACITLVLLRRRSNRAKTSNL